MTYFYKCVSEDGAIRYLLTYDGKRPNITEQQMVEISEDEYNAIVAEIEAAAQRDIDPDKISDGEALDIILGVSE